VVTTGSTVRACAQALAKGGAKLLAVVALARALAD
jgi:predicted amidophosphoribosyltransferase